MKDKPWLTNQICKILSLIDTDTFANYFIDDFKEILLDDRYNIYAYQQFQVWLLAAKHKMKDDKLIQYAAQRVEVNDQTQKPTTASMLLYLSSVDANYKRVILRKINEGFANGYFQNRSALIAAKSLSSAKPNLSEIHSSLKNSLEYTWQFTDSMEISNDEIQEDYDSNLLNEQLFSI